MTEKLALLAISTFRKPDALKVLLQSAFDYKYDKTCQLLVTDDFNGEVVEEVGYSAKDVVDQFPGVGFVCGTRKGVSVNKNRAIKNYLAQKDEAPPYLLLMDDDQRFIAPGLIEELAEICTVNEINHVTGKWSDANAIEVPQLTGEGWSQTFPVVAKGHKITWHTGCHGNAQFYTKLAIKRIGYYPLMKTFYSYEHAIHSAMANKVVDKRHPGWYAQHCRAQKFYIGQNIANRYNMTPCVIKVLNPRTGQIEDSHTTEEIRDNDPVYKQMMGEIYHGLLRKNKESGI